MLILTLLLAAAGWVDDLGGRVVTNAQGQITGVNLRGTFVSDSDLDAIAAIPTLESIDLSHTRVTDAGLLRLKGLQNVRELNLFYAELITDEGEHTLNPGRRTLTVVVSNTADRPIQVGSHYHLSLIHI